MRVELTLSPVHRDEKKARCAWRRGLQPEGRDRREYDFYDDERTVRLSMRLFPLPARAVRLPILRQAPTHPCRTRKTARTPVWSAGRRDYPHDRRAFTQAIWRDGTFTRAPPDRLFVDPPRSTGRRPCAAIGEHPARPVRRGHRRLGRPDHQYQLAERRWLSLGPADAASARRMELSRRRLGPHPLRRRNHHERRDERAPLPRSDQSARAPPGAGDRQWRPDRPAQRTGMAMAKSSRTCG